LKTIIFLNLGALTSILPIFYPPTGPDELHSEPRPDLTFYIIDSHRPWDLNNVFLKEGGVFCVDDGDIEGLAGEGGIGEDYAVLLEVRPQWNRF
jgi:CDC45-like protein